MTTDLSGYAQQSPAIISPDNATHNSSCNVSTVDGSEQAENVNNTSAQSDDEKQHDEYDYFLKRLYEDVVDGTCQNVICQAARLEDQLDLLTTCQQPMNFLMLFNQNETESHSQTYPDDCSACSDDSMSKVPGAYALPVYCEYCGASNTQHCESTKCTRPRLFFARKRPPFVKPDAKKWHAITQEEVIQPILTPVPDSPIVIKEQKSIPLMRKVSDSSSSATRSTSPVESDVLSASSIWVTGLWGISE